MKSVTLLACLCASLCGQETQNWSDLTITFKSGNDYTTNTNLVYNAVPTDLNIQTNVYPYGNWISDTSDANCTATSTRPYLGYPYMSTDAPGSNAPAFNSTNQELLRYLYDSNGFVLGFQVLIVQSQYVINGVASSPSGAARKYYNAVTLNGVSYWALTAYFNYPAYQQTYYATNVNYTLNVTSGIDPCAYGRTASDFTANGFGTGLWLQTTGVNNIILNSTDPTTFSNDTLQYVPYDQTAADNDPKWVQGLCQNGQGTAYMYNANLASLTATISQADWIPYVPLYLYGRLSGVYILTQQPSLQASPRYEVPTIQQIEQTFGTAAVPQFFYAPTLSNATGTLPLASPNTGLHMWFLPQPQQTYKC